MGINVLSLFDGMSCGQIALERAGIKVNNYFASEIDKYAIKVTQKNYPNTIQLGDVTKIKGIDLPPIDLLLGGSPCQGFSFAGKGLNFDDPRSALFFEYVRLQKECKPKNFLLENVRMAKQHEMVVTKYLNVWPIEINSALVSAQNRRRLYWTNIKAKPFTLFGNLRTTIKQPESNGLLLKDIIDFDAKGMDITKRMLAKKPGTTSFKKAHKQIKTIFDKSNCLTATDQRISNSSATNIVLPAERGLRANTFMSQKKLFYRKLSVVECERLQTVPDNYTDCVSNTQRYRMLGNGWTVDVIVHILKHLKGEQ